jgi:PII-like signaling protein
MSNRVIADFLATYEGNPSFADLVAHNEGKGLVGDAVYEAIIHTATHSHYAPGTLSDIETTDLYSQFELQMRSYHELLIRDGVNVEDRARILSELRNALRGWTRDLMSNRVVAEFLAEYEGRPTFEELVAHNEARGVEGDAVYEAIIYSASHSHYATGTLSDDETRTVYTTFELRMREVDEHLVRRSAGLEERARTLYGMRASLRTWTRALMENRELAEWLNENEPNPSFEALVERQRRKGREGDAIYKAIIASATRSRASVNEALGIDPEHPPPLPPMRGPTDND